MMNYEPKPRNIDAVVLDEEMIALTEEIAEHVHDVWARGRMKEGWTYGPERDDLKKTHPCLVPYAQLPESEKAYDRSTAMDTLRLIVSFGYTICRGDEASFYHDKGGASVE